MTTEIKKLLMQPLYKIAAHYELPDAALVSFKKRSALLEKLKEKNSDAWQVVNTFIESNIKSDRIENDKEKQQKNAAQWTTENMLAEEEKNAAKINLAAFCKDNNIDLDGPDAR